MLGIEILKLLGGGGGANVVVLHDDAFDDNAYNAGISFAQWELIGDTVSGVPTNGDPAALFPTYVWLPSGDPADYQVIITGSGFSTGAAGTYACDTGVTLIVTRSTQGTTSAHFSAKIQLASNPGVYLAECSVTISATTSNGDVP